MEEHQAEEKEEIEETTPLLGSSTLPTPIVSNKPTKPESNGAVGAKTPEVEVHLYRQGKGPIAVFKSPLGGWEQDQLEVRDILDLYGLKSIYAFSPDSGRSVSIRFHPRNGRSVLPYRDGTVIHVNGEPKDPMIKPITKLLVGIAFVTVLIMLVYSENPTLLKKFNLRGSRIPPWILTCAIIVFTRMRKRTKDFLEKRSR